MLAARIDIALASTVDLLLNKYYTKCHRAMTQRNTRRCLPNRNKVKKTTTGYEEVRDLLPICKNLATNSQISTLCSLATVIVCGSESAPL